jgi:hypothetical protein
MPQCMIALRRFLRAREKGRQDFNITPYKQSAAQGRKDIRFPTRMTKEFNSFDKGYGRPDNIPHGELRRNSTPCGVVDESGCILSRSCVSLYLHGVIRMKVLRTCCLPDRIQTQK